MKSSMVTKEKKICASDLGIDLSSMQEAAYFKWFLACLLFGKPVQQEVARRTYLEFVKARVVTPEAILQAGWDRLVSILDKGHYTRYDFSTASKLLDVAQHLKETYGTLLSLVQACHSKDELSSRLQAFKGIGPKTAEIFLRDLPASLYPEQE
jgi:endonuclease III